MMLNNRVSGKIKWGQIRKYVCVNVKGFKGNYNFFKLGNCRVAMCCAIPDMLFM